MTILLVILLAIIFGFALGRHQAHSIQNRGEALLAGHLLENFSAPDYQLMNNVTLRVQDGTTQVDHIPSVQIRRLRYRDKGLQRLDFC